MKIAFDYQIFSALEYGGIARYFCEMGKCLTTAHGSDIKVIAPFYKNYILKECSDSLSVEGTHLVKPRIVARGLSYLNPSLFRNKVRRFAPDIIHQTYYWEANKPRSYFSGKIVLTVYDMIHEKFPQYFSKNDPTTELKKSAVKSADHIFCISKQTQSDLIDLFNVPAEKTSVTYLAQSDFFNTPSSNQLILPTSKPYILYVGPREGYKNFSALLKAYARSEKLKKDLEIICAGGGKFSQQEMEEMSALGVLEKVKFLPSSDATLKTLYQGAVAFVYPSLYEGFGIPPLEAMASKCPVICGNTGSIPEVVGSAAVTCDVQSPDSIQAAIELIAYDSEKRENMINLGLKQTKLFSWERCAKDTYATYENL